jgi:hypothetical protein
MPRYRLNISRRFEVATPLLLNASLRSGGLRIEGHSQPVATIDVRIEVHAGSQAEADDEAARIAEGIGYEAGKLNIVAAAAGSGFWHQPRLRCDYDVRVPQDTQATVKMANGPVRIARVARDVRLDLANGPLEVEDCGAAVEVAVVNGPVHLRQTQGPVSIELNNGPILVEDTRSSVRARVRNGPIHYEGAVAGDLDLSVHHGTIVLRVPAGSRFEMDAESRAGRVECELPLREDARAPDGAPTLRLRTDMGNILVAVQHHAAFAAV